MTGSFVELPRSKRSPIPPTGTTQTSIASDRLRKAIERNRRKQAKRGSEGVSGPQDCVVEEVWTSPRLRPSRSAGGSLKSSVRTNLGPSFRPATRKTATETVIVPPRERREEMAKPPTSAARKLSYEGPKLAQKSPSKFLGKLQSYALKTAWALSLVLVLRLILSTGGVLDYRTHKEMLRLKHLEYDQIAGDNKRLAEEIKKIKEDAKYQKKLVRDYLGFIAADEYLILFAKGKSEKSSAGPSPL